MEDEICTYSWVIILCIYDANIVYSRVMEIGVKEVRIVSIRKKG